MATDFTPDLVADGTATAAALRPFLDDDTVFRLLVQSFRAQDHEGFGALLDRFQVRPQAELICEWLCAKHCALVCFELCGPPPRDPVGLDLGRFAEIVAKVSADRVLFKRLAGAVIERDEASFRAILEQQGLSRWCHFICHWICAVRCRLVCDILIAPQRPLYIIGLIHLMPALEQSAAGILRLAAQPAVLAAVEKASLAGDCDAVRIAITRAGLSGACRWICLWICGWRCVRVCLHLCQVFPVAPVASELDEIRDFAKVTQAFGDPEAMRAVIEALAAGDVGRWQELVKRFGVERFCHQLCFWACRLWCRRWCLCVCPPPRPRPWFTHVGHFHIYGDIDGASGLTNKAVLGHGGPGFGFFGCLELRGFCPAESPDAPGVPMRYRFLWERGATRVPLVGALLCPVIVGSRTIFWDVNGTGLEETFQTVMIAGAGATADPTPAPVLPPGTPWGAPPPHVVVPDPDGWIAVDPAALGGGFSGALIGFATPAALPGGAPAPGVAAGTQVAAANLRAGTDIAILFEATRVGGPVAPPDHANALPRIRINNWEEVRLLDLLQFHTGGGTPCSPLSTDLDIEYTADHELMAAWGLQISTAATIPALALPAGTAARAAGVNTAFGTHHEDISAWPTCSYTVILSTRRALTDGLNDDPTKQTTRTFCIGARRG